MFVPTWLYTAAVYGLVLTAACGLYAYYKVRRKLRALVVVGAAGVSAYALHLVHVDAIHITDESGGPTAARVVRLGAPDLPLAPIAARDGAKLWIVNDSAWPVRIEQVSYGPNAVGLGGLLPAAVIPPGTMFAIDGLDYLGPNDRPSDEITIDHGELVIARAWLTWGD